MSWLTRGFLKLAAGSSVKALRRAVQSPNAAQQEVLRGLLSTARDTEFGKEHGFGELLQSPDLTRAYRRQVPLTDYTKLWPKIESMKHGAADVLWPGVIDDYAISSGTSAALNKEIPVSAELFQQFGRFAKQLVLSHLIEKGSLSPIRGKQVTFTSTVVRDSQRQEVRIGQVSGLVAQRANRSWLQRLISRPLPESISQAATLDEKIDRYVDYSMDQDVRMMAMIPWLVLRFMDRLLERYKQVKGKRVQSISEIWPNLSLIICGGQPLTQFRESIQSRFGGPNLSMVEMYGASESMFALQVSDTDPRLFLHPDNRVFFEFVPQSEHGTMNPTRLTVAEVDADTPYVLYITNCSGLWSYCMDDVVSFSSVNPLTIQVIGRASEVLESHGARVTGVELRSVLKATAEEFSFQPMSFHVSPISGEAELRLQWLIEIDGVAPPLDRLGRALAERLAELNNDYKKIVSPKGSQVIPLQLGAFDAWVKVAAGAAYAQAKVPVLSNDPLFANEILKMNRIEIDN